MPLPQDVYSAALLVKFFEKAKDHSCMFLANSYKISQTGLDPAKAVQESMYEILEQVAVLAMPVLNPLS